MRLVFFFLISFIIFPFLLFSDSINVRSLSPEGRINDKNSLLSYKNMTSPDWLLEKIGYLNRVINNDHFNHEAFVAREYLIQLLYNGLPTPVQKIKSADLGIRYAAEGLKFFPDNLPLTFWYSCFVGEKYLYLGVQMLPKVPPLLRSLRKIVKKNPRCCLSAPLFILGRYYFKLPPFPVSYGSLEKSEYYLKMGIKYNPSMILSYLYLADTLYAEGKRKEAISVLKRAEKIKPVTWMELYLYKKYFRGVKLLEREMSRGTWGKNRDIFIEINGK